MNTPAFPSSPRQRARPHQPENSLFKVSGQLLNLVMIALSIAAAYFMTIQSIKVELAAKAESASVAALDKKLGVVEVLLKEGVVNKEEFYRFSTAIDSRLARIEYLISDPSQERYRANRQP